MTIIKSKEKDKEGLGKLFQKQRRIKKRRETEAA